MKRKTAFNVKWEEDYAFTVHENKPLCLIRHKAKAVMQNAIMKRITKTFQASFHENRK